MWGLLFGLNCIAFDSSPSHNQDKQKPERRYRAVLAFLLCLFEYGRSLFSMAAVPLLIAGFARCAGRLRADVSRLLSTNKRIHYELKLQS